jgi:hypothetical protein
VVRWLDKFRFLSIPIPAKSSFNLESRLKLLLLAALDRTSISRKARDLREQQLSIPSGEATLAWLKTNSVEEITASQKVSFFHFLESLPESFQHARRKGMLLAIDFHTDPNYGQTSSAYISKSKPKASTHRFYQYITVIWLNAPEPITLGVQLVPSKHSVFKTVQNLLRPLFTQERIVGLLADGGFYNWDLIQWFIEKQVFFIIRGRVNSGVKPLVQKYHEKLLENGATVVVDYMLNKGHTRKKFPVKLVLCRAGKYIRAFVVPTICKLSGKQVINLFKRRFTIETYYRQMHRFQIFSCSQHPALRFILVLIAFWLCNFWAYFKSPLNFLKSNSRRCRADLVYTANDFCESIRTSWYQTIFRGKEVFSRR